MNNDLINRSKLKDKLKINFSRKPEAQAIYQHLIDIVDDCPTVEPFERIGAICNENCGYRPQGELNADESRLIGVAVDYLLGAELLEENGWSENDIKVLQSLRERYYDEESEEEE